MKTDIFITKTTKPIDLNYRNGLYGTTRNDIPFKLPSFVNKTCMIMEV